MTLNRKQITTLLATFVVFACLCAILLWADGAKLGLPAAWYEESHSAADAKLGGNRPTVRTPVPVMGAVTPQKIEEARKTHLGRTMLVRTVDLHGNPVPDVKLLIWTMSAKPTHDDTTSMTQAYVVPTNKDGQAIVVETDSLAEIRVSGQNNGTPLNDSLVDDKHLSPPFPTEVVLVVVQKVPISVRIVFDTGEKFRGRAGANRVGMGGWTEWKMVLDGKLDIRAPQGTDLHVSVAVDRPGYDRTASVKIPSASIVEGREFELQIKKSAFPKGALLIDMTGHKDQQSFSLVLVNLAQGRIQSRIADTPMPAAYTHRLSAVACDRFQVLVWIGACVHSEEVLILDGEETVVHVSTSLGAGATATIVDAKGDPIAGAVLRLPGSWYTEFPATDTEGVQAVAAASGVATLNRLASTQASLLVDAAGFEPVSVPASLSPGQTARLGTISLAAAVGRIQVLVVNRQDGASYRVGCIAPSGGGKARPLVLPPSGEASFAGLPLRQYTIYLIPGNGGPAVTKTVSLRTDQPELIVELDAAELSQKPSAELK